MTVAQPVDTDVSRIRVVVDTARRTMRENQKSHEGYHRWEREFDY